MKLFCALSLFLLAAGRPVVSAPAADPVPAASALIQEDLFKWGEYDSLIRMLEGLSRDTAARARFSRSDSAMRAKSLLYLGVAYYATGKREFADDVFTRACEMDPDIKLDRFYVSEAIAAHFEGMASVVAKRRRRESAAGKQSVPVKTDREAKVRKGGGNDWAWWTLGSMAAVAGAGGAYYLLTRKGEPGERVTELDVRE